MKTTSIIALVLGVVSFLLGFFVYMEYVYFAGFPDGHITELASAQKKLFTIFTEIDAAFGLWFFCLFAIGMRKKINKKLYITSILYILFIAAVFIINYHLSLHLDDGVGG